eukprot:4792922-Prymnesium_polylepis.2
MQASCFGDTVARFNMGARGAMAHITWEHTWHAHTQAWCESSIKVLEQRFHHVEKERDELFEKFESTIYDVQQKSASAL